jgi:hypothetical protein
VYDDDAAPGETRFEGPGRKVSHRDTDANLILKTIGFHLYVHSTKNIMMNRSGKWEQAHKWPAHQHIKPFPGVTTLKHTIGNEAGCFFTVLPVSRLCGHLWFYQ